jgi:hypothetical protein
MRRIVLGTLAAISLFFSGCDKSPQSDSASPSNPPDTARSAPIHSSPTTRDPSLEPRKNLAMLAVPLILSVPKSWYLEPPQNPAFLEGLAPGGDVHISVSMREFINDYGKRLFVDRAVEQSQQHPRRIQVRQLTNNTGLQVLERITYVSVPNDPPGQSPPATQPTEILSWNITIFVPYQQKFIPCSFDLSRLTQQQYLADQPFIQSIVDSAQQDALPTFQ